MSRARVSAAFGSALVRPRLAGRSAVVRGLGHGCIGGCTALAAAFALRGHDAQVRIAGPEEENACANGAGEKSRKKQPLQRFAGVSTAFLRRQQGK